MIRIQPSAQRQASRLRSRTVGLQPSLTQPPWLFVRVGNHRYSEVAGDLLAAAALGMPWL